jgi:hypothetical protein
MLDDTLLPFSFPAVERKKVTAAFDGGRLTSDGGVMLLAAVENRNTIKATHHLVGAGNQITSFFDAESYWIESVLTKRGSSIARQENGHGDAKP